MDRTDVHRPGVLVPDEYRVDGLFYQGPDGLLSIAYGPENGRHDAYLASLADRRERLFTGNWTGKTTCDICGARFHHGAYFTHVPTGDVVHTGQDCAEKMKLGGDELADARSLIAKRRKHAPRVAEILRAFPDLVDVLQVGHPIVRDISDRLLASGRISEKQIALVRKLAAERGGVGAPTKPEVPDTPDRVTITGKVISTKQRNTDRGPEVAVTVLDDRGFRVWGSLDRVLTVVLEKGERVRFTALVKRSEKDLDFGFFRQPADAEVL